MAAGISLANKSQLLFGFAVLVILAAALSVPWVRTRSLVRESQIDVARQLADAWLSGKVQLGPRALEPYHGRPRPMDELGAELEADPLWIALVKVSDLEDGDDLDPFLATALEQFRSDPAAVEHAAFTQVEGQPLYRYARSIRRSQAGSIRDPRLLDWYPSSAGAGAEPDPLLAVLLIDRTSEFAEGQQLLGGVYIIAAGLVAGLMAVGVFYFILNKLILFPVRRLRETTEKIQAGDFTIRSQIRTGDEFEQLAEAFNAMLDQVEQSQAQLRSINETLDLKVSELSETNIGLFESNRLKSEFLASVSHELKTPLNAIIGFAELLEEIARGDPNPDPKRMRYLMNITTSGRRLLEMINELLDMAKIEAGRMEVNIEPTSVADIMEGLIGVMRPQADMKQIQIETKSARNIPMIETDPGKLQQILYNFLSNAIKFTPEGGAVTLTADRVTRQDNTLGVRLSVADNGPGIPDDMQDIIFEKFRQLDAGHTREQGGTGLGLAICRELAQMLGATVSFVSEPGHGATFSVDLPLTHQPDEAQPLMA